MEGLRAPRIGPSLNTRYQVPQGVGRAAAAAASAAVIGAGSLTALAGNLPQPTYMVPGAPGGTPARTAPVQPQATANPYLGGATGSKAPSLGRNPMPSASRAMPSVGTSMPSMPRGGAGAIPGAIGALLPGLAAAGAAKLQGGDPLAAFKGTLPPSPFSPEAAAADAEMSRGAAANRESVGNALKGIGDFFSRNFPGSGDEQRKQAERNKAQRKGDLAPKNDGRATQPAELLPGVRYILHFTVTSKLGDETLPPSKHQIGFFKGDNIAITHDSNTVYIGNQPNTNTRGTPFVIIAASAAGIEREDGTPMPPPELIPIDPGAPLSNLDFPATNQDSPVLPGAGAGKQMPGTKQGSLPSTGAPTPADGTRSPANPSNPATPEPSKPGGENTPQTPQTPLSPANTTNPGQGINTTGATLSGIPAAPTTGSATATTPIFPAQFTQQPGQRTDNPYQPIQPTPGSPQLKPGCADPCIASLQNSIPPLSDALAGLGELLSLLLSNLQDQQQQQQQRYDLVELSVEVCSCNNDGTSELEYVNILVPQSQAAVTQEQFTALAKIQELQCKLRHHTERTHNILGGEIWFEEEDSREPKFKTKIERKVKEAGTLFGFPALAAEAAPTEGTGGDNPALPVAGQMEAKSIIELLNAYTSNLYHRAGFQGLPTEVPKTLLGYTDGDDPESIKDLSSYFVWFVRQVDALIGKFPINITIEDVDPLTQGNQTKEVELPNISEALAEMYGLGISTSVNADVTVNFLMRLASELIATKNSTLITQDYARANAAFLGYKGNPARREVNYSFDPAKLDSLDEFLKESKGYLVGWEEDDKESVVGFLQRIVFSSGIIKAAFFRDKKRLLELQKELESMMGGDKTASDAEWAAFLALLNDETEYFNKDSIPHPRVRNKPAPPPPEQTP